MSQSETNAAYKCVQSIQADKDADPSIDVGVVIGLIAAVFSIPNPIFTHVDGKAFGAELQHQLQEAGK